jgi:hypothetical protein
MTDLISEILGTACICGTIITLLKICARRNEAAADAPSQYLIIKRDDYETLLQRAAIVNEQPALPVYSEKAPLLENPPPAIRAVPAPARVSAPRVSAPLVSAPLVSAPLPLALAFTL